VINACKYFACYEGLTSCCLFSL